MRKSLLILGLGCLIALGVYAADGIRQVIGGTDTIGSIGLANLPAGVLTNNNANSVVLFTNNGVSIDINSSGVFRRTNYAAAALGDSWTTNGVWHVPLASGTTTSVTNDSNTGLAFKNGQLDVWISGSAKFSVLSSGLYYAFNAPVFIGASSDLGISRSGAAGVMLIDNGGSGSFSALQLGGTTGAFSALVTTNTSGIAVKTATGAAFTNLTAQIITATAGFSSSARNLLAPIAITVGASPFNWTNSSASAGGGTNNVQVFLDANGATTALAYNGTTIFSALISGDHSVIIQPGEWLTVTYSIATPIMTFKPF